MNSTKMSIGTDKELKEEAQRILESMGINLTTYVNMALTQLVNTNSIPFEVKGTVTRAGALERLNRELDIGKRALDEGRVLSGRQVREKFKL